MLRYIPAAIVALAPIAVLAAPCVVADVHDGTLIIAENNKITMLDMDGKKQHTIPVATDARITRDGKETRLDLLMTGDMVRVTTEQRGNEKLAVTIDARSPYFSQ